MVNQLQKIRFFTFGLSAVLIFCALLVFASPALAKELPFPAPTLLVPTAGRVLGQDKAWIGGLARNNSLIKVFVDGQEYGDKFKVKNHRSGTASFGIKLSNLSIGEHLVTTTAQDKKDKISAKSNTLAIKIAAATPTPTLIRPVVNKDSGIERPFIAGNIQNGLEIGIIIDGKPQTTFTPKQSATKITSFAWQPQTRLSLGRHLIEVFASDKGKLSNHAQIFWQVGESVKKTSQEIDPESKNVSTSQTPVADAGGEEPVEPTVKVSETQDSAQKLTVREELEAKEEPVVPDTAPETQKPEVIPGEAAAGDGQGKIEAIEEPETKVSQAPEAKDDATQVKEVSPGAVVRSINDERGSGFKLNNSLIVGITILVFLLLSMVVWYIQERRDKLGDKVVSMFREDEGEKSPENKDSQSDLPPPPPPMF